MEKITLNLPLMQIMLNQEAATGWPNMTEYGPEIIFQN